MSQSDFQSAFEMQQAGLLNTDAEMHPDVSGAPEPPSTNGHNQVVTPPVLTPTPPLASRNGHVSHHDQVADEPYVLDVFPTSGELAKDHREQLKTESSLSDEAIDARGYFTCDDREVLKHHGFPPNLGRCLMIPTYNWRGERVGMIARPDIPLGEPNGKTRKYLLPANAPPVLDVAPLTRQHIDDPRLPLLITEGAKKADAGASRGLAMINLNGVYGFRGKNLKGGLTALSDWENIAFKGSTVPGGPVEGRILFIVFDSDVVEKPGVESALRRLCPFLQERGARVKVVYLPEGPYGENTGLDDFFARGGTVAELYALAHDLEPLGDSRRKDRDKRRAQALVKLQSAGLPVIEIHDRQLTDEVNDLAAAIKLYNGDTPTIFHGVAGLTALVRDKDDAPALRLISREALQVIAAKAANWILSTEQKGVLNVAPPRDLCSNFLASPGEWQGVPPIDRIATAPFFDRDGALCEREGYHPRARTWLSLPKGFVMPDTTPTPANIAAAKNFILGDLVGEVAFDGTASRANAVALMFLPFVRRLIPAQTPLHLFEAPTQASGKTYTAQVCIAPFGDVVPTTEKVDPEENRKALFSHCANGAPIIFIDNMQYSLDDPTISAAITSGKLRGRLIGTGQDMIIDTRAVWVATANNPYLEPDIASRAITIRLDTHLEDPATRHYRRDPLESIEDNRAAAIGAIVTLIRAWQQAGSPLQSRKCRSRFKKWERVMGGILGVIGIPHFLANLRSSHRAINSYVEAWRQFVAAWFETHGTTYRKRARKPPALAGG